MNIIRDTHPQALTPTVATIGFFDGVHLGHRYLIQQVKMAGAPLFSLLQSQRKLP